MIGIADTPLAVLLVVEVSPLWVVLAISILVGLLMVIIFRYTSDQKAIRRAKDQLKAHLLAVRLFQDQLGIVVRAYGGILRGTFNYLRLAFTPLLIAILPVTALIIELDRYFGWLPLQPSENFLVEVRLDDASALNQARLQLPDDLTLTAPPVHRVSRREVVWRVMAHRAGKYVVNIESAGQPVSKEIWVSSRLARISPIRLRGNFWERMVSSTEPALAEEGPVQSIAVFYSPRVIHFAWMDWNWIALFFMVSLAAGFVFKSVLGIQI